MFFDRFNNRKNSQCFLVSTDRSMTGTCRFASDINNICTISNHCLCMSQSFIHMIPFAAVRKGIRGNIQNSHYVSMILSIKKTVSNFHEQNPSFLLCL